MRENHNVYLVEVIVCEAQGELFELGGPFDQIFDHQEDRNDVLPGPL